MTTVEELREHRSEERRIRRIQILDAAERVVGREGIAQAGIASIAREAGVAVGTLYNHFGDRERLLGALVLRHREELARAIEGAFCCPLDTSVTALAERFVEAVVTLFDKRREFVRAALDTELWRVYAEVATRCEGSEARVRHQLEEGSMRIVQLAISEKILSPSDDLRRSAQFAGALQGVLHFRAREAPCDTAQAEAKALVSLFFKTRKAAS